jgi:hypothetical protein
MAMEVPANCILQDCAFKLHYRRLKKARKRGTHSTPKALAAAYGGYR